MTDRSSDSSSSVSEDFRGGQKPNSDGTNMRLSIPVRESTAMHFALGGGYTVDADDGTPLGWTHNLGSSVELKWRGRKVIVNQLDMLRALVEADAPEDLALFDEMVEAAA